MPNRTLRPRAHAGVEGNRLVAASAALVMMNSLRFMQCTSSWDYAGRNHRRWRDVQPDDREQDIHEKDTLNLPLKESIGIRAAQLVQPGDNIIIDSGSTTMTLARHLRGHRDITVMTNGLNIAWELANAPGIDVLLTGGQLRKQSLSLQGSQAEASLTSYSFDTLFLGVDGLDLQFGLTTHDEAQARLNQRMVERARRIVVLTDASKFSRVSLHRIAHLEQVHAVITDASIDEATRDGLQQRGIEVIVVEANATNS